MEEIDFVKYSIVICTYNPDERLLERCLIAVSKFEPGDFVTEVIIVDNNSTVPLITRDSIIRFRNEHDEIHISIIEASKQGLSFARIAGIKRAKGRFIVFLDDDNEPAPDYIQELEKLWTAFPSVGIWGPGSVDVEFVDGVDPSMENYLRPVFQEKKIGYIEYAMCRRWQNCYPIGTGLSAKKTLLEAYVAYIESGRITLTGRAGENLASGDDTQIVLLAIIQQQAAGVSPTLRMNHLINQKKTNFDYLRRLSFGTSSCYHSFHLEIIPEYEDQFRQLEIKHPGPLKVLRRYYKVKFKNDKIKTLEFIEYIGRVVSVYYGQRRPLPGYLRRIIEEYKLLK